MKKKDKTVERVLTNWRGLLKKGWKLYAEGYFLGAWSSLTDKQVSYLLTRLSKKEFKIILDYPIWM